MSKRRTLPQAVAELVEDGDTVYIAGFTHLMPFATVHEIIRQGKRDLTLCRTTPDLIFEQLALAGLVRKVMFGFAGNPGLGTLRIFREMVETAAIEYEEYSHLGLVARLYAGASRLPFMPVLTARGSDMPSVNPNLQTLRSPFDDREVTVVPPLNPDLAILHAQRADEQGNTQAWGVLGEQRDAAYAAERVIVTVEEIVPEATIRSDPNRTLIPGFIVDAVIECPWGAHPSFAQGYYDRDNDFFIFWHALTRSRSDARRWLDEWVYGVEDRTGYLSKFGGDRLVGLRGRSSYATPIDYGLYR